MRTLTIALVMSLLLCNIAAANPPYPYEERCRVYPQDLMEHPRIIGIPSGGTYPQPYARIEVQMFDYYWHPWSNAQVQLLVDPECATESFCWCSNGTYTATTNAEGIAYFYVSVGGCCEAQGAWSLWLDGWYPLRYYDVAVSPAYEGAPQPGDCDVLLGDFTYFGHGLMSAAPGCTDYDGDGRTALADFVIFGDAWGATCDPAPVPREVTVSPSAPPPDFTVRSSPARR
jgi:hypothetical protein